MRWILIKKNISSDQEIACFNFNKQTTIDNKLHLNCYSVEHNKITLSN